MISIHAPRAGSDICAALAFSSTFSISIHAPRAGSDPFSKALFRLFCNFNPRSPCGERPLAAAILRSENDFNPRSLYGERHCLCSECGNRLKISIHAPRAGSDRVRAAAQTSTTVFQSTLPVRGATQATMPPALRPDFNPRSPCGERPHQAAIHSACQGFQSTLPVRGATTSSQAARWYSSDFNPRSPCGERLFIVITPDTVHIISIHAPRAGSDQHP